MNKCCKEVLEKIEMDIEDQLRYLGTNEMDSACWGMQEGVLLSGTETKLILELITKLKKGGKK